MPGSLGGAVAIYTPIGLSKQLLKEFDPTNGCAHASDMEFAERLKTARKHAGLSQAALGEAVGLKQMQISKLEDGSRKSSRKTVELAIACGVRPEWLANGELPMAAANPKAPPTRSVEYELVHERNVPGSRFRRLNEEMLRKAELYAITAEATEGVTYAPVVFNRYLLDAYEIIEAHNGDFPVKDHDQWVSDALMRRQQRGTADGRDSRSARQTAPRGKPPRG